MVLATRARIAGTSPSGRAPQMRRYWRDPGSEWRDGLLMDLLVEELES